MTIFSNSFQQLEWDAMREARWLVHARQGSSGPAAGRAEYDGTVVVCTITARAGCPRGVVVFDLNGARVSREHLRQRLDAMQAQEGAGSGTEPPAGPSWAAP